jgi:hypothetical protein
VPRRPAILLWGFLLLPFLLLPAPSPVAAAAEGQGQPHHSGGSSWRNGSGPTPPSSPGSGEAGGEASPPLPPRPPPGPAGESPDDGDGLSGKVRRSPEDLKRLLQELEESDYGGYGSWGGFRPKWGPPLTSRQKGRGDRRRHGAPPNSSQLTPGSNHADEMPPNYESQQRSEQIYRHGTSDFSSEGQPPPPSHVRQQSDFTDPEGLGIAAPLHAKSPHQQLAVVPPVNPLEVDYSSRLMDYSGDGGGVRATGVREWAKVVGIGVIGVVGAAVSVSPRSAPPRIYSALFKRNLLLFASSLAGPIFFSFLVFDSRKASLKTAIDTFTFSFTWGYVITFVMEIALSTTSSLGLLYILERKIFDLCPEVPAIYLPWVHRDHGYHMDPLSSFALQLITFCVVAPVIEEGLKVWAARKMGALPLRRPTTQRTAGAGKASQSGSAAPLMEPTHVHTYLGGVVFASLGLKAADNARRVFMYTRPEHTSKFLFAFARGFFPLHELCAGLTAMNLARKEILGESVSRWRIYFPAVALHAWANFRGMKPMFKWRADKPWNELQLQAWAFPADATMMQILHKSFTSVVWISILLKVIQRCSPPATHRC